MTLREYAVRIEKLFILHHPTMPISADGIISNATNAMETGLSWFHADGCVQTDDYSRLLEEFSFDGQNLCDLDLENCKEKLDDVIRLLKHWNKLYEDGER